MDGGKRMSQAPSNIGGTEFQWCRSGQSKHAFQLRAVGQEAAVLATLTWQGAYNAVAELASSHYRFSREGWFRPHVVVRDTGAGAPDADRLVATYTQRGGALTLADGLAFTWRKPQRWTNERDWVDDTGHTVMRLYPGKGQTSVVVDVPALEGSWVLLLLALGQYLLVLAAKEAEDAIAAAMTSVIVSAT